MREITITKQNGVTEVAISSGGVSSTTSYNRDANIVLLDKHRIAVIDGLIPFLVFNFSEIQNPYTAENAEEYREVMLQKGYFQKSSSGGGDLTNYILINGNPFEYKKHPDNETGEIQEGDLAINGWITETRFGKVLSYKTGNPEDVESWTILEEI